MKNFLLFKVYLKCSFLEPIFSDSLTVFERTRRSVKFFFDSLALNKTSGENSCWFLVKDILLVDLRRLELLTSSMPWRRSTN